MHFNNMADVPVPARIAYWARRNDCEVAELVSQNSETVTARLKRAQGKDLFIKHSTRDLLAEAEQTSWFSGRFAAPTVADFEEHDGIWLLVTVDLQGASAAHAQWRERPRIAAAAIGEGLGQLHSLDPSQFLFDTPAWLEDDDGDDIAIVHGKAITSHMILGDEGTFRGVVSLRNLGAADRWADLAVASSSIEKHLGNNAVQEFWSAYGEVPDPERIRHYLSLWEA